MSTVEPPNVRLQLSSRPENVALVRAMLAGVAETIDLDGERLDSVRTATTEACNNVVLHAYEGDEGLLEVDVRIAEDMVEVAVRDEGIGIRSQIHEDDAGEIDEDVALELGILVIQALADRVELRAGKDRGAEVHMEFATPGTPDLDAGRGDHLEVLPIEQPEAGTAATIAIAPDRLASKVLPHLVCALAARANFSTDRVSDAQLVADAIAAQAFQSIDGSHLGVGIAIEPRRVELRVGPLLPGGASLLADDSVLGELGSVIEKLTDDHSLAAVGPGEVLTLQLIDRR